MEFVIAVLVATCWIWIPALVFIPFMVWALIEGAWMYWVEGKVYCYLEKAYVTPERYARNYEAHYGESDDDWCEHPEDPDWDYPEDA